MRTSFEETIIAHEEPRPPATPTPPHITVPPGACDSHIHVVDYSPKYPLKAGHGREYYEGTLERYRAVQRTIKTERVLIVCTGIVADNRLVLDTVKANPDTRAVAVVSAKTPDAEWRELEACSGIRGVRISSRDPKSPALDLLEPLAERMASQGRHVQVHFSAKMMIDLAPRLEKLPGMVVIDHFGRLSPTCGKDSLEFRTLARLLETGRFYCKLSAPNRVSHQTPPYDDIAWLGRALVDIAPDRMLWGTDWPNTNEEGVMPDAGMLLDCLATWAPDEKVRNKILVDNPARVYGF